MGRPDTVMQGYLSDKERFADLFNGIFFQGEQFIQSCDLQDSSERYSRTGKPSASRFRDIKQNAPVYTLCLYHGEAPWDGPLSLRDMMDFGDDGDGMERYFADYPLRLFCVNEAESFEMFRTELRELFFALKHRKDREKLQELFFCIKAPKRQRKATGTIYK